jgi:hypothetical protein
MQPDLECVQALTWIQTCHILFCQKAWDAVRVELRLGNVCIDGIVEMLEDHDIVFFFNHD